jgi:hypothetical protein
MEKKENFANFFLARTSFFYANLYFVFLYFFRYVFWYHDDRMVNYDTKRGITVFTSNGPDKTQSRFNIREATPKDSGNYTCKPSNTMPASIQVFVSKGRGTWPGGRQSNKSVVQVDVTRILSCILAQEHFLDYRSGTKKMLGQEDKWVA